MDFDHIFMAVTYAVETRVAPILEAVMTTEKYHLQRLYDGHVSEAEHKEKGNDWIFGFLRGLPIHEYDQRRYYMMEARYSSIRVI